MKYILLSFVFLCFFSLSPAANAGIEEVLVEKIFVKSNKLIIKTKSGERLMLQPIEKLDSLVNQEGNYVVVNSPKDKISQGSQIILLEEDCSITISKAIVLSLPSEKSQDQSDDKSDPTSTRDSDESVIETTAEEPIEEIEPIEKSKSISLIKKVADKAAFWRLKYYFVAQNSKNCELFYGLVDHNPLVGSAKVSFAFPGNGCACKGKARVSLASTLYATSSQSGNIKAKCTDGRTIKGHYRTTSLTTGSGTALDSKGNFYQFTFGHTIEEAIYRVNQTRRELGCPEITPADVRLVVEGKILKQ